MKKQYKIISVFILIAIAFQLFSGYLFNKDTPNELGSLLTNAQNDSDLMQTIGGYRSCEFSYNQDKRDAKERYEFEVTIFGKDAYVNYEGLAQYDLKGGDWLIVKCDTLIKRY